MSEEIVRRNKKMRSVKTAEDESEDEDLLSHHCSGNHKENELSNIEKAICDKAMQKRSPSQFQNKAESEDDEDEDPPFYLDSDEDAWSLQPFVMDRYDDDDDAHDKDYDGKSPFHGERPMGPLPKCFQKEHDDNSLPTIHRILFDKMRSQVNETRTILEINLSSNKRIVCLILSFVFHEWYLLGDDDST